MLQTRRSKNAARWPRTRERPQAGEKPGKSPGARRGVEQWGQRLVRLEEQSSDMPAAEPWSEPQVARRRVFFEGCLGGRLPARRTRSTSNDVRKNVVSTRSGGSKRTGYMANSSLTASTILVRSKGFSKTRRAPNSLATSRKLRSPCAPVIAMIFASKYSRVS